MAELFPGSIESASHLRATYDGRETCEVCNTQCLVPDVPVARFPMPWSEDDTAPVLCTDCWAEQVADETALDTVQAEVLAAESLGFTDTQIASVIDCPTHVVADRLEQLQHDRDGIGADIAALRSTKKLFERL
jgi:hypothetical protein